MYKGREGGTWEGVCFSLRHQGDNQVEALAQQGFPSNPIDFAVTGALGRGDEAPCCWPAAGGVLLSRCCPGPFKEQYPFPSPSLSKSHKGNRVSKPSFAIAISGLQTVPGAFWQHWTLGLLSIERLISGDWGYHLNKSCDHLRSCV